MGFNKAIERREKSRVKVQDGYVVAGMREGLQDNGHKEATANTSDSYSYDEMTSLIFLLLYGGYMVA